ncbi:MAG: O-antigen ligase family protein [Candidatus Gottesmanbacteria bacterium]
MKLHQFLFYLLVIFLPTQLGKHFWPDWSMINGLRIDYLSPTLYLTDIIIIGILMLWFIEKITKLRLKISAFDKKEYLLLAAFSFLLIVNCLFAQNQGVAFYKLVKVIEFSLLGLYIAKTKIQLSTIIRLLSAAVLYSSFLAISQFLNQGSIGGIFYWLGERTFDSGTPGIALAVFNGQLLLRPYATFPHPNVLAGFLVVAVPLLIVNKPKLWWFISILGIIALFLSFSRVAWITFGLWIMGYIFYGRIIKYKAWNMIFLFCVIPLLLAISIIYSPIQQESITYRQDLNAVALKMFTSSPLLGVGLNNFLVRLPEFYRFPGPVYFLQPAHNIFLLIASETGLIGLISLIWFLILTIRRLLLITNYMLLTTLSTILVLGLFDHYFYTLQQGQLLLAIILGLSWSAGRKNVKITS